MHSSSEQRACWFTKGIPTSDINQCNILDTTMLSQG
ncbi:MAG: hypothetical protein ACFBSG_19195 [Leptolyngbyaceae cyanobacterium]